jgi:hypothetical protein
VGEGMAVRRYLYSLIVGIPSEGSYFCLRRAWVDSRVLTGLQA